MTATMDVVQLFNDEIQSLLDTKPPVSKAKMGLITRAAMKGVKFYKHIVQSVEKFISKCRPEYKVPGLYVIDSIVRQSRHQFGVERDVYAARFLRNLPITFNHLFAGCSADDKPKIVRVLNLWQKNGVFNSQIIQPLLDLANPNSSLTLPIESADSPTNLDVSDDAKRHGHSSKYLLQHYADGSNNNSSSQFIKNSASKSGKQQQQQRASGGGSGDAGSLRFSKNMLDFDYDEDDDDDDGDETPTEAEPPLSSTLNKIEMEQRGRNESSSSGHQSSQIQHQSSNQFNMLRNDQDPVLERWNRLIKQQSITNENPKDHSSGEVRNQRSRSRSPVTAREKLVAPREQPRLSKVKSPVDGSSAEKAAERKVERLRKCLPEIRDKHLTVCSSTLWLGHVPKTVSEADISDAFGEFGTITSIDLIPPRGCAYVCMDRRQDAKRALTESKDLKLNGTHIKLAWAPGKGFKEYKKLKDFWEVNVGSSYIPYNKIDSSIDFDVLEEGGVIDEDSMSKEMKEIRERKIKEKEDKQSKGVQQQQQQQQQQHQQQQQQQQNINLPLPSLPILSQPPPFSIPPPNLSIPPPAALSQASSLTGGISFPPPSVTAPNTHLQPQQQNLFEHQDQQQQQQQQGQDRDKIDAGLQSPATLDHQLSMTERQISMVEQQLSMIQQAQGLGQVIQPNLVNQMHHQQSAIFHPNQPNPLLFDVQHQAAQMIHGVPQMMDLHQPQHQLPIFANPPPLLGQPPPILPINQAGMNPGINGNSMPHYGGRY